MSGQLWSKCVLQAFNLAFAACFGPLVFVVRLFRAAVVTCKKFRREMARGAVRYRPVSARTGAKCTDFLKRNGHVRGRFSRDWLGLQADTNTIYCVHKHVQSHGMRGWAWF